MKLLWTGTDSLMLVDLSRRMWIKRPYWWAFRLWIRIADKYFVQEHYVKSHMSGVDLVKFKVKKPIRLFDEPLQPTKIIQLEGIKKKKHKDFNILYYYPQSVMEDSFVRWLYGVDLIEKLRDSLPMKIQVNTNFIRVDGSLDMTEIYPIVDFYLRPNRHDGYSRMIKECQLLDIPYYWSMTGKPQYSIIKARFKKHYDVLKK